MSDTFLPGPTPNTARSADGKVLTVPDGWVLLPPGDAALNRRVKAAGDHWVVAEKKGRKVFSRGIWTAKATVERIRADLVIWAAGASPPMALRGFELPKSERGFLQARRTLQSTANVPVFITGDAADIEGTLVPKAGIYAVRQGPVLWKNLRRYFAGKRLREFRPQRRFLSLLACGDGTAILDYLGFTSHSAWAWMLKSWIDRKWMKRFRVK